MVILFFGLPSNIHSLEQIFKYIDPKSQIVEVRGVAEYIREIVRELNYNQTKIVLYLPLIINDDKHYLELNAYKFFDKGVSIIHINRLDFKKINLETLYYESYKDSLTGLFNYSTCMLHLTQTIGDHYFGFIDIDNFKAVNDTFGHKIGDEVLALVGKKLIEISDKNLIVYRKSGDEFIFMTLNLDYQATKKVVSKIQKAVRSIKIPSIKLDVSIGLVEFRDNNGFYTVFDALVLADIAMYMSKNTGDGLVTYLAANDIASIKDFGPLEMTLNSLKTKGR